MTSFDDLNEYITLPRLDGLRCSPDGRRLVTTVQRPDDDRARYVGAIWQIDPAGREPARQLTRSAAGESGPVFDATGALLFLSRRPSAGKADEQSGDRPAVWSLPEAGEAELVAQSPGGCTTPVTAARAPVFALTTERMSRTGSADSDRRVRQERRTRKVDAILHDGFPIRQWDHEIGPGHPHIVVGAELRDITPDAGAALVGAHFDITPDGATVVTDWRISLPRGRSRTELVAVDVASARRRVVLRSDTVDYSHPVVAPDGAQVAAFVENEGDFDTPLSVGVVVAALHGEPSPRTLVVDADLFVTELAWSADSTTVFLTGDRHGRGAVMAVELATGRSRRLVADAVYHQLCPSPDGQSIYALRTAIDSPNAPVRLSVDAEDQEPVFLPSPTPPPAVPGTVREVTVQAGDGATVRGWLLTPATVTTPTPLQVWIHGGPFVSYNSWSWRWCPWLAVARGWSVLMPDPALSTGYGPDWLARAWPHRAAAVWSDVECLLDTVVARPEIDGERVAALGASFGGYMVNWIAGHTTRFRALVSHAGLWAADQQHTTTDAAGWKTQLFGTPQEHPEWYAENSPHHFVTRIVTPMLISHGNRDYRVPYSEALRLWWDLVRHFVGDPAELPHRFLQLPRENHWVLGPAHAQLWNETVFAFLDWHVLGRPWQPPELL